MLSVPKRSRIRTFRTIQVRRRSSTLFQNRERTRISIIGSPFQACQHKIWPGGNEDTRGGAGAPAHAGQTREGPRVPPPAFSARGGFRSTVERPQLAPLTVVTKASTRI